MECYSLSLFVVLACCELELDGFDQLFSFFALSFLKAVTLSINLSNIQFSIRKILECQESNPGWLGGKREHYLCAMPSPLFHS